MVSPTTKRQAVALLSAIIVLWGANWPIMKIGISYMPPLTFAASRTLLAAACAFGLLAIKGRLQLPMRGDLPVLLTVGVLQVGLFLGLVTVGLQYVEAGRSAVLAYTTPLWVACLAWIFTREHLDWPQTVAMALGLAGIGVLFNPSTFDYGDTDGLVGNVLLLSGAFVSAIAIVHIRVHNWASTPLAIMPWQLLIGGAGLTVAACLFENPLTTTPSPTLAIVLAYNGPIATAFCFWAFLTVARALPAVTTAVGSLGVPVTGLGLSALVLGEPLTGTKITGLALIALGVVVVSVNSVRGQ